MREFKTFKTCHDDLVHDIAYDFYGKRLATCSSDQKIKIWEVNSSGEWEMKATWRAGLAAVKKLAWAHPEFGVVLVSIGYDKTIYIWEEQEGLVTINGERKVSFVQCAQHNDSREALNDISFAPRHLGLAFVVVSDDGCIYYYEASDVMNLQVWQRNKFTVSDSKSKITCVSFNMSRTCPEPMFVIGTAAGHSYGRETLSASDFKSGNAIHIWRENKQLRKWEPLWSYNLEDAVHSVSWAPHIGRSYHLIAAGGKDKKVYILKCQDTSEGKFIGVEEKIFTDHLSEVWRVEWNILGSMLATSGDDNTVKLYKRSYQGDWMLAESIST